jgi:predicted enzyme related to lactoylglutathione lyase
MINFKGLYLVAGMVASMLCPGQITAQHQPEDSNGVLDDRDRRAAIIDSVATVLNDVSILPREVNRLVLEIVIDEDGHQVRLISSEEAAGKTEPKEQDMAKNLACWWEINAKDAEPLVEFYGRIFDWEHTYDENSGIYYIDSGDGTNGGISGGIFTGKGKLPTHRCLYVKVEDLDAITEKVKKQGQPILQGPFDLPSGTRLAFFQDPEGHMIGLIKPATTMSD